MSKQIRNMVLTAMCIALGVVLPILMHAIPEAGKILLPMHITVLLCGLMCSWPYGLVCGVLTPIVSSITTGMPPAAYLPGMICELAIYGLIGALLLKIIRTKSDYLNILLSLIGAMLAGRIVGGVLNALIFSAGEYTMNMWLASYFIKALPGIAIQLAIIPALIVILRKAKIIPEASSKK